MNYHVQPQDTIGFTGPPSDSYEDSSGSSSTSSGGEEDNEPVTTPDGNLKCNWLLNRETNIRCIKERSRLCDLTYVPVQCIARFESLCLHRSTASLTTTQYH